MTNAKKTRNTKPVVERWQHQIDTARERLGRMYTRLENSTFESEEHEALAQDAMPLIQEAAAACKDAFAALALLPGNAKLKTARIARGPLEELSVGDQVMLASEDMCTRVRVKFGGIGTVEEVIGKGRTTQYLVELPRAKGSGTIPCVFPRRSWELVTE